MAATKMVRIPYAVFEHIEKEREALKEKSGYIADIAKMGTSSLLSFYISHLFRKPKGKKAPCLLCFYEMKCGVDSCPRCGAKMTWIPKPIVS